MRFNRLLVAMQIVVALVLAESANGQSVNDLQIKSVFIYNFTQFVEWPTGTFETSRDPFVIGVLGEDVLGKYLEEAVAGEHYKKRPIVIKYFATVRDIGDCQILYVGSMANPPKVKGKRALLTIGEHPEFMKQDGLLRFYKEANKVRIEINSQAAADADLTVSSKLLQLATIYEEK